MCGHPGTNKSSVIKLAKNSMKEAEKFFNALIIKEEDQTVLNSSNLFLNKDSICFDFLLVKHFFKV